MHSTTTKRQFPFSSMKPPFPPNGGGDYHRFPPHHPPQNDAEAIVVNSSHLKRKSDTADIEADSGDGRTPASTKASHSPLQMPVTGKMRKSSKASRLTKCNRSEPQMPGSSIGSPVGNNITPAGSCRYDSSLGLLTKKFINLIKQAEDGILDLNKAAETLEVQKRRIYDITNVLEGVGLIEKLKNKIQWKDLDASGTGKANDSFASLQVEVKNLTLKEHHLDEQIREVQERLRDLSEDDNNQKHLFVTEEDIKSLPCFQDETLIAIKAPHCTTLEVPDPDEAVDYPQRRYRIVLRSTMGPMDVYLISQFEEKLEEVNGNDLAHNLPSSPHFNKHPSTVVSVDRGKDVQIQQQNVHGPTPGLYFPTSQDFVSGITKIVPSDFDKEADYWLLSNTDVSMTDMWNTEPGVEWNNLHTVQEDYCMTHVTPASPQTPTNVSEVASVSNPSGG